MGLGIPGVTHESYNRLLELMGQLGLTISDKKLVEPSTQVICLGMMINTVEGTVSIMTN